VPLFVAIRSYSYTTLATAPLSRIFFFLSHISLAEEMSRTRGPIWVAIEGLVWAVLEVLGEMLHAAAEVINAFQRWGTENDREQRFAIMGRAGVQPVNVGRQGLEQNVPAVGYPIA
jgi:hypothetical protein